MKKFYQFIAAAALLAVPAVAGAQTTADLAGRYVFEGNPMVSGGDGIEMSTTSTVTITASETDANTVYMDGFLGMAVDAEYESSPLAGTYDATAKTITFTPTADQQVVDPLTYNISVLPQFTVNVGQDAEGNIQLTPAAPIEFIVLFEDLENDEIAEYPALLEDFTITKQPTHTIALDKLVGVYNLSYVYPDDESGTETEGTTTFTLKLDSEGQLVLTGIFGYAGEISVQYNGYGITISAIQDPDNGFMLCSATTMGDVELSFNADGSINLDNGIFMAANNGEIYVQAMSGKAVRDAAAGIATAPTVSAASAKIYNLQGVLVGEGSTKGLPAGIYVVGGKKVFVK